MANPDLTIIIEYYESEKSNLESLIRECIDHNDFAMAHFHQEALVLVKQKLHTFHSINDPLFNKKSDLERRIGFIEKILLDENKNKFHPYLLKYIQEAEQQLAELNHQPIEQPVESNTLDTVFNDLIGRRIQGFKLYLLKEENLYLHFGIPKEDMLVISFTPFIDLPKDSYLFNVFKSLCGIGFKTNKEDGRLEYTYQFYQRPDPDFLKSFLARILLDIFSSQQLNAPAYIELLSS